MNILVNQINWEYLALRKASYISFWFAAETLAPITLFEYGYHLAKTPEKLIVGIDQAYERRIDVEIQTRLVLGEKYEFVYSIADLATAIINRTK